MSEAANSQCAVVYLAGPLFSLSERTTNREIANTLLRKLPQLAFILPQDIKPEGKFNDSRTFGIIFDKCIEGIDRSELVLAFLDGCDADSGTAFEVGYAFAKKIPVIGIRTDFRQNQERGLNLMLARACQGLITRPAFDEDMQGLADDVVRTVKKVLSDKRPELFA